MVKYRDGLAVAAVPAGEFWPALRCYTCNKTLVVLRDCGDDGLAVINVDRHGGPLRYDVDTMNAAADGQQASQLRLHRIASVDWRAQGDDGGCPPQSYEFTCGRRCPSKPRKVRNDRLTRAAREAALARRDVLLGLDV